ncbi:UvrD-like helicase, ATP-binding domain, P-loop containing nucleoside triphosphate hydrolase, partial [Tanacetum coccineum]
LHAMNMEPLDILVIDEAAQLKEAESIIPVQLSGLKHVILIGDEHQLPTAVNSNVCIESGFGRSLFDQLSSLGHSKHLLNVQYIMHPSISVFPNWMFYQNQIQDASNVLSKSHEKKYLSGPMFGSYSFVNVVGGREEKDDNIRSQRNMVEVAIVLKIVQNLYRAWKDSKQTLTIGVISPYAIQVVSIQEKLAHKYDKLDGFLVKVKSVDGFQDAEEDIVILSTVRSNSNGHCLWILGNERTLTNSESVWKELVCDARNHHCLFDDDADECLKTTIIAVKKELDQLDDLVNRNSVLFKHAKWKWLAGRPVAGPVPPDLWNLARMNSILDGSFMHNRIVNSDAVLNRAGGVVWEFMINTLPRPSSLSFSVLNFDSLCDRLVTCPVFHVQLPFIVPWMILLIIVLVHIFFSASSTSTLILAKACGLSIPAVPLLFSATSPGLSCLDLCVPSYDCEDESEVSVKSNDARNYVENSKVSESLLLMKFYSLSRGVVSHLLSGKKVDLTMQVTDEQIDIISSRKSSFITGRSGTGKTTVLTTKLFQHEQKFRIDSDGIYEGESSQFRRAEVVNDHSI